MSGQVYLITFTTRNRARHFDTWPIAAAACRAMSDEALWKHSRVLAWVLMPDHWHGLIEPGGFDDLAVCVGRLKGRSARVLRQAHPSLGPIWASAYQDQALRTDESVVDAARYIVMNPVRAGLVSRIGAYPFWDAVWL